MEHSELNEILETFPDKVADAFEAWGKAAAKREHIYGKTLLTLKAKNSAEKISVDILKAMVLDSSDHYEARLSEVVAEAAYKRLNEKLMAAKKLCDHRTAF